MQSWKGGWRTPLLALTAVLLAMAPAAVLAGSNRDVVRQQEPKSREDTSGIRPAFTSPEAVPLKKPTLYPRTEPFWGLASGPTYAFVRVEASRNPDAIMPRVRPFVTSGRGPALPNELRAPGVPVGASYYLVQFTADAFAPAHIETSLEALKNAGADLIDYVPNNAYLVRIDAGKYQA